MHSTIHVQVYLVTGGWDNASSEILLHGYSFWTQAGRLPHAMSGLRTVSIDNHIIATGQHI